MWLSLNYQTLLQISQKCYQTFLQNYSSGVLINLFCKISNFVSKNIQLYYFWTCIFKAAFQIRVDVAASMQNLCLYIGLGRRSGSSCCCQHKSPHGLLQMSGRCSGKISDHPALPVKMVHGHSTLAILLPSASLRSIHSRSY